MLKKSYNISLFSFSVKLTFIDTEFWVTDNGEPGCNVKELSMDTHGTTRGSFMLFNCYNCEIQKK